MSEPNYSNEHPKWSKATASGDCKKRRVEMLTIQEMKELALKVKLKLAYQKVNKPKTEIEKKLSEAYLRIYGKNDLGYYVEKINEENPSEE